MAPVRANAPRSSLRNGGYPYFSIACLARDAERARFFWLPPR